MDFEYLFQEEYCVPVVFKFQILLSWKVLLVSCHKKVYNTSSVPNVTGVTEH